MTAINALTGAVQMITLNSFARGTGDVGFGDVPFVNYKSWVKYTIQPADTLTGIAKMFGTTVSILQSKNSIPNKDHIKTGNTIYVPSSTVRFGG